MADTELVFHCVICGDPIPASRITRKAVTCSDAHALTLKNARRRLRDMSRCRLCNRPSTPEERALFTAWRKTLGIKRGRPAFTPEQKAASKAERKARPKKPPEKPDAPGISVN